MGFWSAGDALNSTNINKMLCGYGVVASRPSAGDEGRLYFATDDNILYRDNGSTWDKVIEDDPAVAVPGLRTLGTGSQQAAAGDHTHVPTLQSASAPKYLADDVDGTAWQALGTSVGSGEQISTTFTPASSDSLIVMTGIAHCRNHSSSHGGTLGQARYYCYAATTQEGLFFKNYEDTTPSTGNPTEGTVSGMIGFNGYSTSTTFKSDLSESALGTNDVRVLKGGYSLGVAEVVL